MNCPLSLGSLAEASFAAMVTIAVSLSVRLIAAELATVSMVTSGSSVLSSVTIRFSRSSKIESSRTEMSIVAVVCPAAIKADPERAAKSLPSTADPLSE